MPLDQEKIFNNQIIEIIMIYKYIRFSTDSQDEQSQNNIIETYCDRKGIRIDKTIKDEATSGASDLTKRELLNLLNELKEGDTLIISELSRLTRKGTIELNNIIGDYFQPSKLRLIICNYGLDIDCSHIDAMTEMMLNNLATFARVERDSLRERVKAALKARRDKNIEVGGTNQLWGKNCNMTDLERVQYRHDVNCKAAKVSAERSKLKAQNNPNNVAFAHFLEDYILIHGQINFKTTDWDSMVLTLNKRGLKTARGMDFDVPRAKAMYQKYNNQFNAK